MGEATKTIMGGSSHFFPIKPMDYARFLVISLETGTRKIEEKYTTQDASKWGMVGWLTSGGTPLINVFTHASPDMVYFHLSTAFQALHIEDNYLRIQDGTLTGELSSVDITTKRNLDDLVETGEALLKKQVTSVNLVTGANMTSAKYETNEDALKRFARMLSQERRLRHLRSPHGLRMPMSQRLI